MGFPSLGISYKWDHAVWDVLCPASFTRQVFEVCPHCRMCQCSVPFDDWTVLLATHPLVDVFLLAAVSSAAMKILVQEFIRAPAFSSLGYVPRSGTSRSHGNSMFKFLRNHQTVSHSSRTIFHSHQVPSLRIQPCHLSAAWPWAGYFCSRCLSFLICLTRTLMLFTQRGC